MVIQQKKVQAIFNYNGENLLKNSDVKCPDDEYTHQYLLIVNKDSTYEIRVDGEEKAKGNMKDDWSFEKPKTIKDPDVCFFIYKNNRNFYLFLICSILRVLT